MHVVIICNEYPPAKRVGGIGIFVKNLSIGLIDLGHEVTIVGLYNQAMDSEGFEGPVYVIRISSTTHRKTKMGWLLNRRRLHRRIRALHLLKRIDIIETSDYEAGFFLMPRLDVPRVVRINGSEVYFRTLLKEPLSLKNRFIETASLKKADSYAAVTNFAWDETFRLFKLKPRAKQILPNFIDTSFFRPDDRQAEIRGRIIYTGSFIRKKGVLELFKCLNEVFRQCQFATIVCIGADTRDWRSGFGSTRQLAMTFLNPEFHDRVQFVDPIPNLEVKRYLLSAQVCVYPSFLETQGIVIVEAMACEKAVISTNIGPGPEIIDHGSSGYLCHPEDHAIMAKQILELLNNELLRKQIGAAARISAINRFSRVHLLSKNVQWYHDVINKHRDYSQISL